MSNKLTLFIYTLLGLISITSCVTQESKILSSQQELQVSFVDNIWDGHDIPKGQECKWSGGNGATPELKIDNIPDGVNTIIVEFSDKSYPPMDNGGHGKIGTLINNQSSVIIPSIKGETTELPLNFFIEAEHKGLSRGSAGAYLPPCSLGNGDHHYYITVKALYRLAGMSKLIARSVIKMGNF